MLKVAELIKHLSIGIQENNPLVVAFSNFLNNFAEPTEIFNETHLDAFFSMSLDYAHWQQHRDEFAQALIPLLHDSVDMNTIKWPDTLQTFEVEQVSDLTEIIENYLNRIFHNGEKFRLIVEQDKKIVAVVLTVDQKIQLRMFDRKVVIKRGLVEPLKKNLVLFYNQKLELEEGVQQCYEMAPFVTAQFRLFQGILEGAVHRGYMMQKIQDLTGLELSHFPKLFYSIKRLEQYFIQRQSDPFYIQAIDRLEKAIESAKIKGNYNSPEYIDLLAQSNNILEYVFTGDKLLTLLIRDLQHTLNQRDRSVVRTPQKEDDLWNFPQIQVDL